MTSLDERDRSLEAGFVDAMHAMTRVLTALEGERRMSDATREAAAVAATLTGRAARQAAAIGGELDRHRRTEDQLRQIRAQVTELELRVGELYRTMQEQEEWPAG